MGLNLKIKRIIFETLHKWDGVQEQELSTSQIKQIGGRAGRYGVNKTPLSPSSPDEIDPNDSHAAAVAAAAANLEDSAGVVTCLVEEDMDLLRSAMAAVTAPLPRAALHPTAEELERFTAQVAPSMGQNEILELFPVLAASTDNYFIPSFKSAIKLSAQLDDIPNLTVGERWQIGNSPVNLRDPLVVSAFKQFTTAHAQDKVMRITSWIAEEELSDLLQQFRTAEASLDEAKRRKSASGKKGKAGSSDTEADSASKPSAKTSKNLKVMERLLEQHNPSSFITTPLAKRFASGTTLIALESLHRCISLYLWLANRFLLRFPQKEEARLLKNETQDAIDLVLQQMAVQGKVKGKAARPAVPSFARNTAFSNQTPWGQSPPFASSRQHRNQAEQRA